MLSHFSQGKNGDRWAERLLDAVPAIIWVAAPDKGIVFVNQYWEERTGFPRAEALGSRWLQVIHPEDRDRWWTTYSEAIDARLVFQGETRVCCPGDVYRRMLVHGAPHFAEDGEFLGYVGTGTDVTEQRRTERALKESNGQLSSIFKQTVVGIVQTDAAGCFIRANPRFAEIIGRPVEELLKLRMQDITHPEDLQRNLELFNRMLVDGQDFVIEKRFVRPDGSIVWVNNAVSITTDADGARYVICVCQDVSARKAAEDALRRSREQLRRRVEHRTRDLADANERLQGQAAERERMTDQIRDFADRLQTLSRHLINVQEKERECLARELHDEIGQSLTAVRLNLEAIGRTLTAGKERQRLDEASHIVESTLQQIQNLSLSLRPSLLDDFGLVAALRWLCDSQAQRAGIDIRFEANRVPKELDSEIVTNSFRIVQEALTNVVRHASATTASVELRYVKKTLTARVEDKGTGFDLERAHLRRGIRRGLGLLGMEERAALIGGRLDLHSAPGEGTVVRLTVPLRGRALTPNSKPQRE